MEKAAILKLCIIKTNKKINFFFFSKKLNIHQHIWNDCRLSSRSANRTILYQTVRIEASQCFETVKLGSKISDSSLRKANGLLLTVTQSALVRACERSCRAGALVTPARHQGRAANPVSSC